MNLNPIDDATMTTLPKANLMGQEALEVFMEQGDNALAGLLAQADGKAYFVKMIGPKEDVIAQQEKMRAFAASITEISSPAQAANANVVASFEPSNNSGLQWTAAEGWTQADPRPMRLVTYQVSGAECYIAVLGGAAGGVEANVNRWRGQMGKGLLSAEELANLRKLTVLGVEASMVEITGSFSGQSGESATEQMMLGLVCPWDAKTVFVKMVGPKEAVSAQVNNFVAFCESLQPQD